MRGLFEKIMTENMRKLAKYIKLQVDQYVLRTDICIAPPDMLKPQPAERRYLKTEPLEVIRVCLEYEDMPPWCAHALTGGREPSELPLYALCEESEKKTVCKPEVALTKNRTCQQLERGLPSFQTVRSKHLLFKPPSLWYSVMATQTDEDNKNSPNLMS